jgi:hypothetical protein
MLETLEFVSKLAQMIDPFLRPPLRARTVDQVLRGRFRDIPNAQSAVGQNPRDPERAAFGGITPSALGQDMEAARFVQETNQSVEKPLIAMTG